jgi:hypothetical protein
MPPHLDIVMGITGISEFTFGFAFLFEQTHRNWAGLQSVPVLPSLQAEADKGWDAKLPTAGTDYYYQFKLSDYLFAKHAKFIKDGTYNDPYFRIALHRKDTNRQHRRLKQHSLAHPETYYVAPEFTELKTFNDSFLARDITMNSRLIPLQDCDDINDGAQHYITYQLGLPDWKQHSEPKRHTRSESGRDLERVYRESKPRWKPIDRGYAEGLFEGTRTEVLQNIERFGDREEPVRGLLNRPAEPSTHSLIQRTAELVSVYYGATMVLIGSK